MSLRRPLTSALLAASLLLAGCGDDKLPAVSDPTFSPSAGTFDTAQSVTLATSTAGASIRYTVDGTTPSESAGTPYTGAIAVPSTTTIKAIAYKSGMANSPVSTGTFTIVIPASAPTFSPLEGTFDTAQSVTLATSTTGASIRYTVDGTTPSESAGTPYTGAIAVTFTTTIKAIAYKSGMANSPVSTGTFTIVIPASAPTFSPLEGTFDTAQSVTLATSTAGASIRYTVDGTTPSESAGTPYTGAIAVPSTTTIKAIA